MMGPFFAFLFSVVPLKMKYSTSSYKKRKLICFLLYTVRLLYGWLGLAIEEIRNLIQYQNLKKINGKWQFHSDSAVI